MSRRAAAQQRAQMLKDLRSKHQETVNRTQQLLREQKKIERAICSQIRDESKTVPEIAEDIDVPPHRVLWYLTALTKYDVVQEDGRCGEFILYLQSKE